MGLKKLFKKKPGGTMFGNVLRSVTKLAADSGLVPGAGLVSSLLPAAPPAVFKVAQDAVANAASYPALNIQDVKEVARDAKQAVLNAGGSETEASNIGAAAFTAASLPPFEAAKALDNAAVQVNSFGAKDVKKILNGAVEGAQSGAIGSYLETELGKQQKSAAINVEVNKALPYVLGLALIVVGFFAVKRK